MGQIAKAQELARARVVLDESARIGDQAISITGQVNQMAAQFLLLRAEAADAEDAAVFDARLASVITKCKQSIANIPADRRAVIQSVVNGIFN